MVGLEAELQSRDRGRAAKREGVHPRLRAGDEIGDPVEAHQLPAQKVITRAEQRRGRPVSRSRARQGRPAPYRGSWSEIGHGGDQRTEAEAPSRASSSTRSPTAMSMPRIPLGNVKKKLAEAPRGRPRQECGGSGEGSARASGVSLASRRRLRARILADDVGLPDRPRRWPSGGQITPEIGWIVADGGTGTLNALRRRVQGRQRHDRQYLFTAAAQGRTTVR